jgi:hypothetical protein
MLNLNWDGENNQLIENLTINIVNTLWEKPGKRSVWNMNQEKENLVMLKTIGSQSVQSPETRC